MRKGSCIKLGDGAYYYEDADRVVINFRTAVGGRQAQKSLPARNVTEARKLARDFRARADRGEAIGPTRVPSAVSAVPAACRARAFRLTCASSPPGAAL